MPTEAPSPSEPASGRVLVVEPDPIVGRILQVLVGSLGFEVDVADNGEEALPLLAYRDYAAVICDVAATGMCGEELLGHCQARRPEVAHRFVFLTDRRSGLSAAAKVRTSGQPCLPRPCAAADLRQAIEQVTAGG